MRFISVCSGIEAASVAWNPLGWEPLFFSEIDKFPSAVLAHRHPNTPNLGDMTNFKEWDNYEPDLLAGGTPCQSFSVAGLRQGLRDPRGNLALTYLAIADKYRPQWVVWENVPGVLSSNKGRDFGTFLGALGELGYGWSYRVLDAQFFGVPQRRRRVFVVGYLGDWRRAAAVLFESHSLSGDSPPSREEGKGTANCFEPRSPDGVARQHGDLAPILNRMGGGQREPCVVMAHGQGGAEIVKDGSPSLTCNHEAPILTAWGLQFCDANGVRKDRPNGGLYITKPETAQALTRAESPIRVQQGMQVRRLTPIECERLQGFPDNYTQIPWRGKDPENCPDGHRYKALGNSMAAPCMSWLGERIQTVNNL